MNFIKYIRYFLVLSFLNLVSCYYQPDLRSQSTGSLIGGVGAGLAVGAMGGDLIALGAGGIVGSTLGGMIGQEQDNHSPLMLEDPINDPVDLFYYQTVRAPIVMERFYPGQIQICR